MSQTMQILSHLKAGKAITAIEALTAYGTMRLGARIYDLRQAGYAIEKQMVEVETRDGIAHVARYWMKEHQNGKWKSPTLGRVFK